jgi:putative oxidoreductase
VLCAILFTHGAYRFYEGSVPVMGEILGKIGFPVGVFLAYCVNIAETAGTALLAARFLVVPICVILSFIYVTGIALFHRHEGFFVVGPGTAAGSTARYSSLAC